MTEAVIVIPAFKPDDKLVRLVEELTARSGRNVIVIDDGSGDEYDPVFAKVGGFARSTLLKHAINLGKGAALKTGFNHAACNFPEAVGVVTADADGQHGVEDILNVCRELEKHGDSLVMGARQFGKDVPPRSKFGNVFTRYSMRLLIGTDLSDTQTGLRGIPIAMAVKLLQLKSSGYEFELDMLIMARQLASPIVEVPISTIYIDNNTASHFNPILDSMKIYFTLLRFTFTSILTTVIDYAIFVLAIWLGAPIIISQFFARLVAGTFNYQVVKTLVFYSKQPNKTLLPKYIGLVAVSGLFSYGMIRVINNGLTANVIYAKIMAETLLFIANFAIQRDFIFTRSAKQQSEATDWDSYYLKPASTAKFTRRITKDLLIEVVRKFSGGHVAEIAELGGANSCFVNRFIEEFNPDRYHIIDNNQVGLDMTLNSVRNKPECIRLVNANVLNLDGLELKADLVFSIGLIEHFSVEQTRNVIRKHFELLKPGGICLISYPTPTFLYRIARTAIELVGRWQFPDERPIEGREVIPFIREYGEILFEKINWSIILTQQVLVVRKYPEAVAAEPELSVIKSGG